MLSYRSSYSVNWTLFFRFIVTFLLVFCFFCALDFSHKETIHPHGMTVIFIMRSGSGFCCSGHSWRGGVGGCLSGVTVGKLIPGLWSSLHGMSLQNECRQVGRWSDEPYVYHRLSRANFIQSVHRTIRCIWTMTEGSRRKSINIFSVVERPSVPWFALLLIGCNWC